MDFQELVTVASLHIRDQGGWDIKVGGDDDQHPEIRVYNDEGQTIGRLHVDLNNRFVACFAGRFDELELDEGNIDFDDGLCEEEIVELWLSLMFN